MSAFVCENMETRVTVMDVQVSSDVVATGPEQLERNERRQQTILVPGRVERDARSHTNPVRSSLVHQTT